MSHFRYSYDRRAALHRFESMLRQTTGEEWKGGYLNEYRGGMVSVVFVGPKKKFTDRSTVEQEPFGRFLVQWHVDNKADVMVSHQPWVGTHMDLSGGESEKQVDVDIPHADEAALRLLHTVALKAKPTFPKISSYQR